MLEGIQSLVLQTFFKLDELYKPTGFTNHTYLTNLLLEGIGSSVLQILQTFYKPFARKYIIMCFTHLLQILQTLRTLQTVQTLQTLQALQNIQTFTKPTNLLQIIYKPFTNDLQTFCSKV